MSEKFLRIDASFQDVEEKLRGFGKYLMFFPCDGEVGFKFREKGAEAQVAVVREGDELIEADHGPDPLLRKKRRIIEKVICHAGLRHAFAAKPFRNIAPV